MSSKGKCVLKKRKEMLHEKLNQIADESRNIIELIHDIQIRATSIVSDLDLETDEREFLLKYPTTSKKLEEWQTQVSRISYDLDVLVCEENRREPEELNTTSVTSQGRQKDEHRKVEKAPSVDDIRLWTVPCPIQENDILDMRFVSGDSPHDFWLRFYSTKELKQIGSSIQKLFEANKLPLLTSSEVLGGDVCVCNGSDYFRGRVINRWTDSPTSYMIRNVDNGSILKIEKSNMYHLTEELAKFPVQAINCCLEGVLGDPVLWDAIVVKLFHQVMEDSSLVVTICSVPTETCSKFVVKVDAHNEMRAESKIDLSNWITYSVLPTLVQRKTSKSADTLKFLFDFLRPKTELENSTTTDCISKPQDVERKENIVSRKLCVKDNVNSMSNSHKEKSDVQQQTSNPVQAMLPHKDKSNVPEPPSNTAQQICSLQNFSSTSVHDMLPHKDKSMLQEASNAAQDPFLNLFRTSAHAVPHYKDKSAVQECSSFLNFNNPAAQPVVPHKENLNVQQWPPSVDHQFNPFLNLRSLPSFPSMPSPTNQYVPHFSAYQNPSMIQMGPPPRVNQPAYPYAPQMQQSLVGLPPFHSVSPSVALQQQNQPQSFQLQLSSSAQNRFLTKQHSSRRLPAVGYTKSQSNTEDTQKGRGHRTRSSLEGKQKDPILISNTLHPIHNHVETASAIKQTPSAEAESFGKDFSASKQEMSQAKVISKNKNGLNKVSLKYPNLKFEAGGRYQAFVVHINDPDDFYVHVACENTAFIETLDQEMTENYKTCSVKLKNKEQAKIMLYESWCAVFYEDGHLWHRGKVIDWRDDNGTALEVQYVDYGEVREIDLSKIKPLKEEYTKLPICATRCRLANIHPHRLQDSSEHTIWPSETIELFKVLAVRDKLHSIIVTDTLSDPISVLLVTEDSVVINKLLLDFDHAIAINPIEFDSSLPIQLIKEDEENVGKDKVNGSALEKLTENCQKDRQKDSEKTAGDCQKVDGQENALQTWDPMADDYYSVDNTEYRDDENACYAVSGYVPQDEQRICKFYATKGRCFKGVTCTKEHSLPNPDGWTTDRETVLQNCFSSLDLPPVNTLVTVEVTAITTVNKFYAHILWEGRAKEEEEETLLTLNRCINSKDSLSKMKRPQVIPAVGQLVLARFMAEGNSNFFRARVVDTIIEESKVQVVYVDYGNNEWVSEKHIREIEPQYLHLPFQALECYISNVNPTTHSEEALVYASDLLLGKHLAGMLRSKNGLGRVEIELWADDQKIADKLIEKGYAEYKESPLFLTEGASIIPG